MPLFKLIRALISVLFLRFHFSLSEKYRGL
nr:MAG TPA: hypothetical protein [Caudoviricetes sp.]